MLYSLQKEGAKMKNQFYANIERVESAIQDAGYVPYDQLYGFLLTGNSAYITRKDNARRKHRGKSRPGAAAAVSECSKRVLNQCNML